MPKADVEQLIRGVQGADRGALARAITLVESTRPEDTPDAHRLLSALAPTAEAEPTRRIGISGVPGAGKSSLLEALGMRLIEAGHRVAVLAVDPTSARSGGSILGDKTRMEQLAGSPNAFVRPTPGGGQLGGVARRTREAVLVCESAGFDTVFVETIGIGQSEAAVRDLVDTFVLMMLAGAGDDLQGIKRGVLELADLLVVSKADGDNVQSADGAAAELRGAMQILHGQNPSRMPWVGTCSTKTGTGIDAMWQEVTRRHDAAKNDGSLAALRRQQDLSWFEQTVDDLLRAQFLGERAPDLDAAREAVRAGREFPITAARRIVPGN